MITQTLNSSYIKSVSYDEDREEMVVTFQDGKTATHYGVDQVDFDSFMEADSPGRYYRQRFYGFHTS